MSFMKHKLRRSAVVVAVAVGAFQALSVVGATVASAVGTCSFSGGVFTVAAPAPDDNLFVYQDTNGGIHVATTNGGAYPALGTATDLATCSGVQGGVATTTAINITGDSGPTTNNQTVVIYMNKFVSAAVAAPDASATNLASWATINWTVNLGSNGAVGDSLVFWDSFDTAAGLNFVGGANGLDINNDGDLDVTMAGVENFSVDSASNDTTDGNVIDLNGSTITGGPVTLGSRVGQHPTAPLNAAVQTYASSLGATLNTSFNTLNGGAGNDVVVSGAGDDTIGPGLGSDNVTCGANSAGFGVNIGDWLDYSITTTAINANLSINTVTQGTDLDSVLGCENVIGTSAADTLTGDGLNNALQPGGGDDTVTGGVGTADIVDYSDAEDGVTVDLTAGTATGGSGSDKLASIEDVNGSDSADDIMGNTSGAGNFLFGNGGNDMLNGGSVDDDPDSGVDRFDGGSGIDTVSYVANTDPTNVALAGGAVACDPGDGTADLCTGANGVSGQGDLIVNNTVENAILGTGDDTFTGSAFNNIVWPNGGQNALTGVGGIDTVNYSVGYTTGVLVNLTGGGATGGGQDSITGFTNAVGTEFNDTLLGTDVVLGTNGANLLVGGKGNDSISGNAGPDLVRAGAGNDRVRGGTGDDTLKGQGGKDNIRGSAGADDIFGGKGKDFCNGGGGNDFIKTCERPRHNGQGPNGPGLHQRL